MIPLVTTTVTFRKANTGGDPYESGAASVIASGVAAHISTPTGRETAAGGQREAVDAVLACEPVDGADHYCTVTDETTGETWDVSWLRTRRGLGLDHIEAGLITIGGGANG